MLHHWADELHRFRPGSVVGRIMVHTRAPHGDLRDVTLTTICHPPPGCGHAGPGKRGILVVLDEAQAIKNPDSQGVARVAAYSLRANFRLALTGTPIENRLDELWSQFHF